MEWGFKKYTKLTTYNTVKTFAMSISSFKRYYVNVSNLYSLCCVQQVYYLLKLKLEDTEV